MESQKGDKDESVTRRGFFVRVSAAMVGLVVCAASGVQASGPSWQQDSIGSIYTTTYDISGMRINSTDTGDFQPGAPKDGSSPVPVQLDHLGNYTRGK